ncbi:MAG: aromatic ring-hydroxylating dioxygenase subunit alpha, partial [Betaproteobacteria bacterium]|nr:aromatic ring-hydroxylating dioxygenase subunit alpha [Betaproteobacteria bacterium]
MRSSWRAMRSFSSRVMEAPGDCSPSRMVVSKMINLSVAIAAPEVWMRKVLSAWVGRSRGTAGLEGYSVRAGRSSRPARSARLRPVRVAMMKATADVIWALIYPQMRKPLKRLHPALPAAWYRDQGHYERELQWIWYRTWIAAGREEQIPQPGDWRVVRIGTQSVILARDRSGVVRAFHNTCRHRGSILCTEEQGRFARHRIVCPYHSWTYDLEGALIATPRRMETPDFDKSDFPLHRVATQCWGGFVFVRLEGKRKFDLGALPARFRNHGFHNLRIGKRIVTEVKANWKLLAENFSECLHCPPVHPELCRVVTAYREAGAWGLRGKETIPEYKA